ncbi:MAG: TonB family protein [Luteitalea sp.]|nr:TonB family protein [Luteitalea sp.]
MISISFLAASTIKVSLIVGSALLVAALLRKQSAAVRHWVLSVAIVCAVVVPLLQLVVPSWHLRSNTWSAPSQVAIARDDRVALNADSPNVSVAVRAAESNAVQPQGWELARMATAGRLLGQIWMAGLAISLGVLLVGLTRLAWLASRSRRVLRGRWVELVEDIVSEYGLRRPVLLLQSNHQSLLVTWGLFQPKVILPAAAGDWPDDRIRVVLAHELAHIRRRDWLVQMTAELLRSVYWFNPLVWMVCTRLRLESEHACDDAVLNRGVERLDSGSALAGGVITQPKRTKNADPVYPASLAESGIEGRVELKARIDTSGAVTAIEVLTSPHPELANAAVEAVNQWQYTPTLLNGVPVEPEIEIAVTFSVEP